MSPSTRRSAGVLLVILPTVAYGGFSLLGQLLNGRSGYIENPIRQNLWRAGHAHAGVLIILSLVLLPYIDEAALPEKLKHFLRWGTPGAAILIPAAFFFSVPRPDDTEPNALIWLAYLGFLLLILIFILLGIGLLKRRKSI